MRTNAKAPAVPAPRNHEGIIAHRNTPIQELRRTVCACLLWEDSFYESGQSVADRIKALVATTDHDAVAALAIEARENFKLRHVPLLLARELVRAKYNVAPLLARVIQRPDELTEFLSLYWKDGKTPLAASVKRGLAAAFQKFNAYSLAKYNRADAIKLRDVLFLVHAKPKDEEQAATWKQLVDNTLPIPDTWEVALSSGADKKEAWTRLLAENKLGGLALLRNLRNMEQAGIAKADVAAYADRANLDRVLPFRFIAAASAVPVWEDVIERAMLRSLADAKKLAGRTVLLVDTSPSMYGPKVSQKSELDRADAAFALAILLREICEEVEVVAFSSVVAVVPPRRGFALRDAIRSAVPSNGTLLGAAVGAVSGRYDRLIVITDEQSQDAVRAPDPEKRAYMLNVATYQNGVGYGPWTRIDGWSEAVIDFIQANETPVLP